MGVGGTITNTIKHLMCLFFTFFLESTSITFQTITLRFLLFICCTGKLATGQEKSSSIDEKKNWHIIFTFNCLLLFLYSVDSLSVDDSLEELSFVSESEVSLSLACSSLYTQLKSLVIS